MTDLLQSISQHVIAGHAAAKSTYPAELRGQPGVEELVADALSSGLDANTILQQGLLGGMEVVGQRFGRNEMFIPQVLVSCAAMRAGAALLKPHLAESQSAPRGEFIIGTVRGDLHDIGKNLVAMMLEGAGFQIVDLGVNVTAERFIEAARQHPGVPVGLSALLSTTMMQMARTVKAINEAGLPSPVLTVVGGAPVTEKFAREIGATAFAPDAASAVDVVKEMLAACAA